MAIALAQDTLDDIENEDKGTSVDYDKVYEVIKKLMKCSDKKIEKIAKSAISNLHNNGEYSTDNLRELCWALEDIASL